MLGEGKRSVDILAEKTNDQSVPLARRLQAIDSLVEGLRVCAPGAASHLAMAAQDLQLAGGGIRQEAARLWELKFSQALKEFAQNEHGGEPLYRFNEIHYVNGYRNLMAGRFGVVEQPDVLPPSLGGNGDIERCLQYLEARVNATSLVRHMAESCFEEIRSHFAAYAGRVLSKEDVAEIYAKFESTLDATLELQYGKIDPSLLVYADICSGAQGADDDAAYRLVDSPVLIMHAIARNLGNAGILEPFRFAVAAGGRGGVASVKRIGEGPEEAYYVKLRERGGKTYDVWQAHLVNGLGASPVLIRRAMADTKDPARLARLAPEEVWAAIDHAMPLPEILAALKGEDVMRYRQASAASSHRLVELALEFRPHLLSDPSHVAFGQCLESADREVAKALATRGMVGPGSVHQAVRLGDVELVSLLLPYVSVEERNEHGSTPLLAAAAGGHLPVVAALVANGADVNAADSAGRTAGHHAAALGGDISALRLLAEAGCRFDVRSRSGRTPLITAAETNNVDVIEELLRHGTRVGNSALRAAAGRGNVAAFAVMLRGRTDPAAATPATPVETNRRHAEAIRMLVAAGADVDRPDSSGATALLRAVARGDAGLVQALIDLGDSPTKRDRNGSNALDLARATANLQVFAITGSAGPSNSRDAIRGILEGLRH